MSTALRSRYLPLRRARRGVFTCVLVRKKRLALERLCRVTGSGNNRILGSIGTKRSSRDARPEGSNVRSPRLRCSCYSRARLKARRCSFDRKVDYSARIVGVVPRTLAMALSEDIQQANGNGCGRSCFDCVCTDKEGRHEAAQAYHKHKHHPYHYAGHRSTTTTTLPLPRQPLHLRQTQPRHRPWHDDHHATAATTTTTSQRHDDHHLCRCQGFKLEQRWQEDQRLA